VFGIRLARQPAVVLVGPDLLRFFFESTDTLLSMGEVYGFLEPIVGDRVLFTAPKREYDEQRRIMLPAFHGRKLRSWAMAFVNNELKVILGMLLRRYEVSLVDPRAPAKVNSIGVLRPAAPCLVRYRRRSAG
jgi:cytochrome P450